MDKNTYNNYIENLPKPIKDFVFNSDWEEKVIEICKKYGLNEEQTNNLTDSVVLILVGLEKPNNFLSNMISDLNISKLLAEQILEDLENRVFDHALKQIEKEGLEKNSSENTENKEKLMSSSTQLELKPENLPMIEENEPLRVNPVPKPVFQNEVLDKQTIGVPRYGQQASSNIQNPILEKKLNTTTNSAESIKKYEKDPYREPLE